MVKLRVRNQLTGCQACGAARLPERVRASGCTKKKSGLQNTARALFANSSLNSSSSFCHSTITESSIAPSVIREQRTLSGDEEVLADSVIVRILDLLVRGRQLMRWWYAEIPPAASNSGCGGGTGKVMSPLFFVNRLTGNSRCNGEQEPRPACGTRKYLRTPAFPYRPMPHVTAPHLA